MSTDLLFYDIEVFKKVYMAVFMDIDGNYKKYIAKDWPGDVSKLDNVTRGFEEARALIRGKTLVGFNNYHYDDNLLPQMLANYPSEVVFRSSSAIINKDPIDNKISPKLANRTLDCRQQIDTSQPGLKKIEANLGLSVLESSVPFDKVEQLNEDEVEDTFIYCSYDVLSTSKVYKLREGDYFKAKDTLVSMIDDDWSKQHGYKWNTTTIGAKVLLGKSKLDHWKAPFFDYKNDIEREKNNLSHKLEDSVAWDNEVYQLVPDEVLEMWKRDDSESITIHEFDNDIVFGFGGIHSSNTKVKKFENVINVDVTSMYPNLIIKLGVLGSHTDKFKTLVSQRIEHKKSNPPLAAAEKIIINSVYGLMDMEYSAFFNHQGANAIRFYGQAILYDLGKKISDYATIVQLNTDGMAFVPNDDEAVEEIKKLCVEFMGKYGLNLEKSEFKTFIQKDVNNYIAVKSNDKLKVKGKDVSRYEKNAYFRNNSTRIIDKGVVDYFIYGVDPEETVKKYLDQPLLFQFVLQAGRTYEGTFDENGKKYNAVNRVFAGVGDTAVHLMKKYPADNVDKNGRPKNPVAYSSSPDKMIVWDETLEEVTNIPEIDVDFYVDLIKHVISNWTEADDSPVKTQSPKGKKQNIEVSRYDEDYLKTVPLAKVATDYIAAGMAVYPLAEGTKIPKKGTHGPLDATTYSEMRENWVRNPTLNLGLALNLNNLIMLDVDLGHQSGLNGYDALQKYLKDNHLKLPDTYSEKTPTGGIHMFFQVPSNYKGHSVTGLLGEESGIDIQVAGTPVYPSLIKLSDGYGQYEPMADHSQEYSIAPQWLLDLIDESSETKVKSKKRIPEKVVEILRLTNTTVDSNRNDNLFAFGSLLKSVGLKGDNLAYEITVFNEKNVEPPLKQNELKTIIKSLTK